ncbi:MAG: hypothetical protein IPO39_18735 [Bacteroidetes bacterium]|nr:hypothetical protein [Bacteroidota bacterium]
MPLLTAATGRDSSGIGLLFHARGTREIKQQSEETVFNTINTMSRFKIGQGGGDESNPSGNIVKGKEYTIDGFSSCINCGEPSVYLLGYDTIIISTHGGCGHSAIEREKYLECRFAPLQSFGEQIEESISKEAEEFATWAIEAIQTKP